MPYNDGTFSSPVINGPKSVSFPLLNGANPDKYARVIKRNYVVSLDSYVPTAGDRTGYTNEVQYSQTLQNAYWNVSLGFTVTDGQAANPSDGAVSATKLTETAATGLKYHGRQSVTITAGQNICFSVFLKAGTSNLAQLIIDDVITSNGCYANFNLATGEVGTSGAFGTGAIVSASIYPAGEGFYRCVLVGRIAPADTAARCFIFGTNSASASQYPSYTGSTANYLFAWQMQFERGVTTPGPAIATTSAARTISSPPTDFSQNGSADSAADPFAYLVDESELSPLGGNWTFSRTYARIPSARTDYSNRLIVRPLVDNYHLNTGSANYWAATVDNGLTFHVFSSLSNTVCGIVAFTNNTLFNFQTVNHGAAVGDAWIAWSGNKITGRGTVRQVFDVNNFYAFTSDLVGENVTGITAMTLAKNGTRYVVEPAVSVSVLEASAFYMANVSLGITTPADIPLSSPQIDAVSWMNAVVTNANYAVAEGTSVEAWNGWPIYRATTASVEMSDAKVVVSASA